MNLNYYKTLTFACVYKNFLLTISNKAVTKLGLTELQSEK